MVPELLTFFAIRLSGDCRPGDISAISSDYGGLKEPGLGLDCNITEKHEVCSHYNCEPSVMSHSNMCICQKFHKT